MIVVTIWIAQNPKKKNQIEIFKNRKFENLKLKIKFASKYLRTLRRILFRNSLAIRAPVAVV